MTKSQIAKASPEELKELYKKDNDWKKENADRFQMVVNKKYHLAELLQAAIDKGFAVNKTQYMLDAILERLKKDGIV